MNIQEIWGRVRAVFEAAIDEDAREASERKRAMGMLRLFPLVKDAVNAAYPNEWQYLVDIYHDGPEMFALTEVEGRLYRIPVSLVGETVSLGERVQVTEMFPSVETPAQTRVFRQADGRWRWFSVSASAVVNKDGEIDSRALFDNLVQRAEESGDYPYRTFYHRGEAFRTGQTDFLARDGYLLISSGLYDDGELAALEVAARQESPERWGDSIHYKQIGEPDILRLEGGVELPVYNDGELIEISTLLSQHASGWFTTSRVQQEVVRMLDEKAMTAFVELFGGDEDKARTWLTENVDEVNRTIAEQGLVARSTDDDDTEPEDAPIGGGGGAVTETVIEMDEATLDDIVRQVAESGPVQVVFGELRDEVTRLAKLAKGLQASLAQSNKERAALVQRVKDLERGDEEKQREWLKDMPRHTSLSIVRPRIARDQSAAQQAGSLADVAAASLSDWSSY